MEVCQMRAPRTLSVLLAPALLVGVVATTGQASAAPRVPTLVDVRAEHRPGIDRVVFEFTGGVPESRQVRYVSRLVGDGSGLPVRIAGRAVLRVRMELANAHDRSGATAPGRRAFALPNVMTAVRSGDFEAVTTYGIGVAKRTPFTVSTATNPDRVVVDVRAGFRTVPKRVWLFNEKRYLDNTEPFFTPVLRPVRPGSPAVGLMDRLFAGPLPSERADGLRLLRSRAKDFADLRVQNGIARLRLTGGCSSGGSTVTIAGSIMPTLRRLATVDFVKIYDPAGATENPTGRSDSIPECLEP
jgi:hypothetical protein